MHVLEKPLPRRLALSAWLLGAFVGAACLGCMTSGTFDNIPNHPIIESTSTRFDGPTPSGGGQSSRCPERAAPGACPADRVQCFFDDHGCELCTCSQ